MFYFHLYISTVRSGVYLFLFVVVVWWTEISSIYHYCILVVSNKWLKFTVLLSLLGCRQTSSSERWIWRHDQQKERTGTQHHDLWTKARPSWKADRRTGWRERPLDGSCSCTGRKIWQDHWWRTFVLRRCGLFGSFHCGLQECKFTFDLTDHPTHARIVSSLLFIFFKIKTEPLNWGNFFSD